MTRTFTENQQKLIDRVESLRPNFLTQPWLHGYLPRPEYYHRLSIDWDKCQELALYGYRKVKSELGNELYFTQALIAGCVLKREKRILTTILGTGLGKSFVFANINLIRAKEGEAITAFAPNRELNNVIFRELASAVSKSTSYKKLLFDSESKAEAMNKGASQRRFAFPSGGFIDLTIAKNATGVHSSSYMDEYSLLSEEEASLAAGRAYFHVDKNGLVGTITRSSNPHIMNHSYLDVIKDPLAHDEGVIWGDWRLNVAEGKFLETLMPLLPPEWQYLREYDTFTKEERDYLLDFAIETIINSPFFNNEDDLRILYLSEFGINTQESFFTTAPKIDDSPVSIDADKFSGLDVATRGKDQSIYSKLEDNPDKSYVRITDFIDVKPREWIDHETPIVMANNIINENETMNSKLLTMDATGVGEGQFNLLSMAEDSTTPVYPVRFGDGVTPNRTDLTGQYAYNKRAELFMDFKAFIDTDMLRFTTKAWKLIEPEFQSVMNLPESDSKKVKIEPKEQIKKRLGHSTDYLDSAMLALHGYVLSKLGNITEDDEEDDLDLLQFANRKDF